MKKLIIYGVGDFAKLLSVYLCEKYEIVCYTIEKDYLKCDHFLDKLVIPFEEIETIFDPKDYVCFVAVGYKNINQLRERICAEVKSKKYNLISYVHPTSIIAKDVKIGENTFIFENVVIQPFAKLGENLIVFSSATICHDTIIEKNCFIGSNACINGFAKIMKNSFLGSNSTIRNNITIGKYNIIGAGCTILMDTNDNAVYKSGYLHKLDVNPQDLNI